VAEPVALPQDELSSWIWLLRSPGISRGFARRLLSTFGSPQAVVGAQESALAQMVGPDLARTLLRPPDDLGLHVEATMRWLQAAPPGAPRAVLTLGDPAYPRLLLETPDPPLLLFASGRFDLLSTLSLAIVGSRRATHQGRENARAFAEHLSQQGLTIVSGLAAGIDAAAHEGGLAGDGKSVAFVGTGLDEVYPPNHRALAERMSHEGLVVSEYLLGTPPMAANFPQRNRLIAGCSLGTLVVEAAAQSGSLITARLAAECGREVFAIPGSIHAPLSRGCHRLIQQGAKLVAGLDDVLPELRVPAMAFAAGHPGASAAASAPALEAGAGPEGPLPGGTQVSARTLGGESATATVASAPVDDSLLPDPSLADDARLVAALGHDPVSFDALAARTGLSGARLAALLLGLELTGRVHRLPGGLFQGQLPMKGSTSAGTAV